MVNSDNFGKRLTLILDHYGLSASAFADLIHVQRSSISHILSGRNKPSLDFILKLNTACPDLNLHWFLNGSGTITDNTPSLPSQPQFDKQSKPSVNKWQDAAQQSKPIERIVVFYKDGSFKAYTNEKSNII